MSIDESLFLASDLEIEWTSTLVAFLYLNRMLFVVFSELSDSTSHAMNDIIDLSVTLVGFIYFIVR